MAASPDREKHTPKAAYRQTDLEALAPYMMMLLMRNVTSEGFVLEDPSNHGSFSRSGEAYTQGGLQADGPGSAGALHDDVADAQRHQRGLRARGSEQPWQLLPIGRSIHPRRPTGRRTWKRWRPT